jgi:myo-inositol-1(or 4)-monophosphatase
MAASRLNWGRHLVKKLVPFLSAILTGTVLGASRCSPRIGLRMPSLHRIAHDLGRQEVKRVSCTTRTIGLASDIVSLMAEPQVSDCEFQTALEAAQAAASVLQLVGTTILADVGKDIKAQADLDAERALLEVLRPTGLPILSEEMGADAAFSLDHDGWIIDPLDGTMNFVRGIPVSCTCVSLWRAGRPVLGVIQENGRDCVWAGGVGRPTTCNGAIVQCGNAATPESAILTTGFPRCFDFSDASLGESMRRMSQYKKVRMIGCAGLALAWTAGGMMDLYREENIFLWDVAAGIALVQAAGGHAAFTPIDEQWRTTVTAGSQPLVAAEHAC